MTRSLIALIALCGAASTAVADGLFDSSRLAATGGITQLEGAAGGGIVPWALISGLGSRDSLGATAFFTSVNPTDFQLDSKGASIGFFDRTEISFAQQRLGLGSTVPGQSIRQDIAGVKVRLMGDAVFEPERWLPQLAVGLQYKNNQDYDQVPKALGARRGDDVDFYLAATKLWFAAVAGRNLLTDFTLRATRANQMGLLGFGGDLGDRYKPMAESSVGVFLCDRLLLGGEYRMKPNNLSAYTESDFRDAYLVLFAGKHVALTAAYAWLGNIANQPHQHALFLSAQLAL